MVHVVSLESENPLEDYNVIRGELGDYDESLLQKDEIILLSKTDLVSDDVKNEVFDLFKKTLKHENIHTMTAYDDDSIKNFKSFLTQFLDTKKEQRKKEQEEVLESE